MTKREFIEAVSGLAERHQDDTRLLRDYLLALWALLLAHRSETPSYALFSRLLTKSFTSSPARFEEEWLSFKKPHGRVDEPDDFKALEQVLLFQIADLHRMGEDIWGDPHRYLGRTSPTGNTWYNFDPATYLDCGASGLLAHDEADRPDLIENGWRALLFFLELGRLYE